MDTRRGGHRPSDGERTGVGGIITEAVGLVEAEGSAGGHRYGLVHANRGGTLVALDVNIQGTCVDVRAARVAVVGAEGQRAITGLGQGTGTGKRPAEGASRRVGDCQRVECGQAGRDVDGPAGERKRVHGTPRLTVVCAERDRPCACGDGELCQAVIHAANSDWSVERDVTVAGAGVDG